jgi:hypothetical protein
MQPRLLVDLLEHVAACDLLDVTVAARPTFETCAFIDSCACASSAAELPTSSSCARLAPPVRARSSTRSVRGRGRLSPPSSRERAAFAALSLS